VLAYSQATDVCAVATEFPEDDDLQRLFARDPDRAWRVFVDAHTPFLVALIHRAGLRDHDEAMEVYTLVCERLSADDCARLRDRDAAKGALRPWLTVVVRHAIVDWVRHRAGRRRLFGSIQALDEFHREVFQLYFWEERPPSEITEELAVRLRRAVSLAEVLSALGRIHDTLSDRQRSELVSAAMRSRPSLSLDDDPDAGGTDVIDDRPTPDRELAAQEAARAFDDALGALPDEDAAIIRLRYVHALSLKEVQRALHLPALTEARVKAILDTLRRRLVEVA
jgi:DNA-directed RNA polymerase specialized sigma24 family protein